MSKDRGVLISAFLIVSATYATLYTVAAHDLARWGWTCRGTLGDATFLPFPTGPQGVLMDVMAKMSPSDEFIYAHLVRTGALVGISILLWILAAIYLLKVVLPLFWKSSSPTPVNLLYFQPAANMLRVCASAPLVPKMSLFDVGLLGQLSSEFEQLLDGSVTSIFLIVKLLKLVPLVPMTPVAFIDTSPHALAGFKAGQQPGSQFSRRFSVERFLLLQARSQLSF